MDGHLPLLSWCTKCVDEEHHEQKIDLNVSAFCRNRFRDSQEGRADADPSHDLRTRTRLQAVSVCGHFNSLP